MAYNTGMLHPVTGKFLWAVEYNELARIHGWETMPDWEAEFRDKLYRELPSGVYEIGGPGMYALTGKGGKIEFEVALRREIREYTLPEPAPNTKPYSQLSYEKLKGLIADIFYGKKNS